MGLDPDSRRNLRRYLIGAVLVRLADEGARVAVVLLALQRTGSAGVGGELVAALLVPHVVAAPAVGLLTDRARRPRYVIAAAAGGYGCALAFAAVALGRAPLGFVLVALVAGGACGPALLGGLTSRLSALVPPAALPRAFGLDSLSYNVSGIVGPAVAGLLGGVAGPAAATLALAASAVGAAAVLSLLPDGPRANAASAADGPRLRDGALVLLRERVLGVTTAASCAGQLGAGSLPVVGAVVAGRLGLPAAGGWLMAALAGGGLLGSMAWTWRPVSAERAAPAVMVALAGMGVPLLLAAGVSSLAAIAALFALSGFFIGPFTGALFTVRQDRAPARLRAQVFGLGGGLKTTSAAAGASLAGAIGGAPSSLQLVVAGAWPLLAGAAGAACLVGVRARSRARTSRPRTSCPETTGA